MKILIEKKNLGENLTNTLRLCGYIPNRSRESAVNFVRPLSRLDYPRFHIYVNENEKDYVFNLHLDQKKPAYQGYNAHQGEYDGVEVENEGKRIKTLLNR